MLLEKFIKKMKKPVENRRIMCYNRNTGKRMPIALHQYMMTIAHLFDVQSE
jgi:hypothetical protein